MWEPSDIELVRSWLSYRELHESDLVLLNPWNDATKALRKYCGREFKSVLYQRKVFRKPYDMVGLNPRAFLIAYNKGMDFLSKDGGGIDPATFPNQVAILRGNPNADNLFSKSTESAAITLLQRTIEIENGYAQK